MGDRKFTKHFIPSYIKTYHKLLSYNSNESFCPGVCLEINSYLNRTENIVEGGGMDSKLR